MDPDGKYAGVDDAVFTIGGTIVGIAGQIFSDLFNRQLSGWEDYVGSAIGGAVFGETLLYTGPIVAGAAGAASSNVSKQFLKNKTGKQKGYDATSLVVDTAVGAATGFIPGGKISKVTTGRGNMNSVYKQMVTKIKNQQISKIKPKTAVKMFVGRSAKTAVGEGTIIGSGIGSKVSPMIPTYGEMEYVPNNDIKHSNTNKTDESYVK